MDFHLYRDHEVQQCSWIDSPLTQFTLSPETSEGVNFDALRVDGKHVGLIVGWTDLNLHGLWGALNQLDLERAKAQLACADGTFAGVFCVDGDVYIVTDASGSIPIYYGFNGCDLHVASKADTVAKANEKTFLDPVSIADFLQNGAVCHPFTLFDGVRVAPPASISYFNERQLESRYYWTPVEKEYCGDLKDGAIQLRETVRSALKKGLSGKSDVTVMFSGGEDARSLVKLLPQTPNYRLRLISSGKNREYTLACQSARKLGFEADLVVRERNHYRNQFADKVEWAGAGNDVRHFHVFGAAASIMSDADAVVGGLGSDKLFKSDYVANVANKSKESFLPERLTDPTPDKLVGVGAPEDITWMRSEVANAVWQRHLSHHEILRQFRPRTAGNWHTLWPLGGHSQAHAQFLNNIRYGPRVVEPFIAASTYKLASALPDECRVDRQVFSAAFVPIMGQAAWVPTTAGRIPALNGFIGRLIQFGIKSWRVLYDKWQKKRYPKCYGDQGPWSSDHKGFDIDSTNHLPSTLCEQLDRHIESILAPDSTAEGFWSRKEARVRERKVLAVQVGQAIYEEAYSNQCDITTNNE